MGVFLPIIHIRNYGRTTDLAIFGNNNIATSPLYFVRSGYVVPSTHNDRAGRSVYSWSTRSGATTKAYSLNFGPDTVYPSGHYERYLGFSVRCVAG